MFKENKTEAIKVVLTKTDRERLEEACKKYGRSISSYVRELIIKSLDEERKS